MTLSFLPKWRGSCASPELNLKVETNVMKLSQHRTGLFEQFCTRTFSFAVDARRFILFIATMKLNVPSTNARFYSRRLTGFPEISLRLRRQDAQVAREWPYWSMTRVSFLAFLLRRCRRLVRWTRSQQAGRKAEGEAAIERTRQRKRNMSGLY
jgi:hypothetical protein